MAKTTKKEFTWTKETEVKVIEINQYEKRSVKVCELNGKEFVVLTTIKKIKDEWKPVKNATIPKEIWSDVVDAVSDYDLGNVFDDGVTSIKKVGNTKVVVQKEKPVLKGKKLTIEQQLENNENYSSLKKEQQKELIQNIKNGLEHYGMVGAIISKTSHGVRSGVSKDQAEKELRKIKGFSRAKFTFITE